MTFVLQSGSGLTMQDSTASSKVTATVFGMELNGTTETYKVLYQGQLSTAGTANYTPGAGVTAFIKSIHLFNTDSVVNNVRVSIGGAGANGAISSSVSIPAGGLVVFGERGYNVYNAQCQRIVTINSIPLPYNGGAASFRMPYAFETSTSAGASTSSLRFSTASLGTGVDVQTVYMSTSDNSVADRSGFFAQLAAAVNKQDVILSIFQSDTNDATNYRFRVTSVTNNTTYYALGVVTLSSPDNTVPSASTALIAQFDIAGKGQPSIMIPPTFVSSNYGFPAFNINTMVAAALTASKLYAMPFWSDVPFKVIGFRMNQTIGGTGTLNVRYGLYRQKQGSFARTGNKLLDALWTNGLSGTGGKNIAVNQILPAGYYIAVIATPATMTATMNQIQGLHDQSVNFDLSGATPFHVVAWGVSGTDYVAAAALPAENTTMTQLSTANLSSTQASYSVPFWLEYRPLQ